MKILRNLESPMRDGVVLRMDLYACDDMQPRPVILMRTPYGKQGIVNEMIYSDFNRMHAAGYHVAVQDCRGTGESDGVLHCNGDSEYPDGYDTVEWLAVQPFCNGHVGMDGLSYNGFDQMAAAVTAPEHLDTICPFMTQVLPPYGMSIRQTIGCYHLGWIYGQLLRELDKHIPDPVRRKELEPILRERFQNLNEYNFILPMNQNPAATVPGISMFDEYLRVVNGVEDKAFWTSIHHPSDVSKLKCSVFHATGWFDAMKDTTVDNYQAVRDHGSDYARANNRLLIGPWDHGATMSACYDGFDFGSHNSGKAQDVVGMLLRWYDHYMKGEDNGVDKETAVRYYVMVADQWREDSDWPPTAAKDVPMYLHAGGVLNGDYPFQEEPDNFTYDPQDPMPSFLRDSKGRFLLPDWSEVKDHAGMLIYETQPLDAPMNVAGTLKLTLFASTDALDTDFSCRVTDVAPDGYEFELAAGIVRAKYRDGVLFEKNPITPGKTVEYTINVGNTARQIIPGHRLKVYVSSALYPAHDRNLNTGAIAGQTSEWVLAHQTIYHDEMHASCLHLPVVD